MNETHSTAKPESKKPFWKHPIIHMMIFAVVFIALRGWVIAGLMGGSYSVQSFVIDTFFAVMILWALQGFDFCLTTGLKRLIGEKNKVRRVTCKLVRLTFVIVICGTFLLATAQLHPPKIGCAQTPIKFGMQFSEHTLTADDGIKISAWSIPVADSELAKQRPAMVVTHGLGANKQNFLHVSAMLHDLDYNVVAFDFRAHGDSEGRTCTLGVKESLDVKAAYDFAIKQFPNRPVYIWSTSMGGAATLRAAAEYQIFDKIVVDATFTSVRNVAMETKFCYIGPLANSAWMLSRGWYWLYVRDDIDAYGPEKDIANITAPIFLIHGTADPIIPFDNSERLQQQAKPDTQLWMVEDAGHCGSLQHPDYALRLSSFYESNPE